MLIEVVWKVNPLGRGRQDSVATLIDDKDLSVRRKALSVAIASNDAPCLKDGAGRRRISIAPSNEDMLTAESLPHVQIGARSLLREHAFSKVPLAASNDGQRGDSFGGEGGREEIS
jgi:hypothetical protein